MPEHAYTAMKRILFAVLLSLTIYGTGCSMTPRIAAPPVDSKLPDEFDSSGQPQPESTDTADRWWETYEDSTLNELVDSVLVRNLDLHVALARVLEVQQLHSITRSAQFPSVQLSGSGIRQITPTNSGVAGSFSENIPQFPKRFDYTTYSASLGFSYELDFWGKARSNAAAALGDFVATEFDYQAVRIGIVSETIATYFEILDLRRQTELTRRSADLLAERAARTEDRYRRGLVSSFEMYAIRQSREDAAANVPALESRLFEATGRLAVLLGTVSSDVDRMLSTSDGPRINPDPIPAGIPSDLLLRRPDVRAAEARLEAMRQRIGVARANRFPSFSLTATGGTQSSDLVGVLDSAQRFGSIGGTFLAPLFRAGALKADVKAAWARYDQAAASYEKTVLTAFKDISSALVAREAEWRRLDAFKDAMASASSSSDFQLMRYRRGVGDYLALLDARINAARAAVNLSTAEHATALARLAVHRALGGVWISEPFDSTRTHLLSSR